MALDNGYHFAAQALPTPTDTPYETPSRGLSGQSSRQGSSSPFSNYSPAPFPPEEESYFPKQQGITDGGEDDRYNARDPRRLTPNLGISFVSQIHSLKKELESRDASVGNLEESLHQSRAENEQLSEDLNSQRAEVKSIKYQMSSLEHDMLQALEDIAKERDGAIESVADGRKRLEVSKKKARQQEEEYDKANSLWDQDKQAWEKDRRKMEGEIHVVEERLKTMVAEMMAVQSTGLIRPGAGNDLDEGMRETWSVRGNDIRVSSRLSNRSMDESSESKEATNYRASRMSGLHGMGGSKMSGLSLADELEMGEDDEEFGDEDFGVHSPNALPEEVYMASRRYSEDKKARKVMGFNADPSEQPFGDETSGQHSMGIIEDYINLPGKQTFVSYADKGTQYTPPPSPTVQTKRTDSISENSAEQTEANQSRKRVAIPSIFVEQTLPAKPEGPKTLPMVSTSCQTDKHIQGPPSAPVIPNAAPILVPPSAKQMISSSTQTIEEVSKSASSRLSPTPLEVPVIAIHPPASRPSSSHNSVVLPPRTRNAGCQAVIEMPKSLRSISAQTEEIRIDKRHARIPPRLQPSSLSTKPSPQSTERRTRAVKTSIPQSSRRNVRSPPPLATEEIHVPTPDVLRSNFRSPPPQGAIEKRRRPTIPIVEDAHPESNDNGPLTDKNGSGPRRPIRSYSSFTGLEAAGDNNDEQVSNDFSDDNEFANAAPIRKTLSKVQNSWKLVPQSMSAGLAKLETASEEAENQKATDEIRPAIPKEKIAKEKGASQTTSKTFQTKPIDGIRRTSSAAKPVDIRRKALVSNGIVEHAQRARSPSAPNISGQQPAIVAPPFPVPTRSSSRKIPTSASDGAASPTPYSTSFFTTRRGHDQGRSHAKRKILRKVQSAAAVSKLSGPGRHQPLPSMSASSIIPGSPRSLPLPPNQFILPYDSVAELRSRPTVALQSRSHAGEASIETPNQQTSVVDAIAQTMVGEWMWKYVRKRTSFGISENPQAEFEMGRNGENGNGSGVRHKRWVWLAPYENVVIWSSKQPTSGPALLGKGGRKLMIQSVLDVKDDTPLPKNAGSQSAFDRSILILTPQRALKFTAVSRERHYIWLTALSFLSHSTRGMDDLASPPPLPKQEYQPPPSQEPTGSFRRTPIRDSIRVAKGKSRPSLGVHSFSSPIGEVEQKIIQDTITGWGEREPESEDAAEPPQVPRVAAHARKRSSTGPRPVPLSAFHSYPTSSTGISSSFSLQAPTSRDKYDRFSPGSRWASASGPNTSHTTMTRRTIDTIRDSYVPPPPVVPDNFFDPAGTMRMEAFVVDRGENACPELIKAEPAKAKKEPRSYRTRQGRKKDMSYWGVAEPAGASGAGSPRVKEDPFTGF